MFRSPSYLSSSYLTWSPSAAVPIEFVVAAAGRSATPPSPCRGLLYTPSHAPGDLYSDPFSPMSPPRHRGPESQIADSLVLPLRHPHALRQEPLRLVPRLRRGWAGQRLLLQPAAYLGCVYILTRLAEPPHPAAFPSASWALRSLLSPQAGAPPSSTPPSLQYNSYS